MGHGHHGGGGGGGFGGGGHHHSNKVSPSSSGGGGGGGHHHHGNGFSHAMHEIKHEVKHDFNKVEHGLSNFGHKAEHELNHFGHDVKHEFNHLGHQMENGFNQVGHGVNQFGNSVTNQAEHLLKQAEHRRHEDEERRRHEHERHEHLHQHYRDGMNARTQMNYIQSQMFFNNMLAMNLATNSQYYGMAHYGLGRNAYAQNQWVDASNHYYLAMQSTDVPAEERVSQAEIDALCARLHQETDAILNDIIVDKLLVTVDCDQATQRLNIALEFANAAKKLNPADGSVASVQERQKQVSQKKVQIQRAAHEATAIQKLSTFNEKYAPLLSQYILGMENGQLAAYSSSLKDGKALLAEVQAEFTAAQSDMIQWPQVAEHDKQLNNTLSFVQAETNCREVAHRFNTTPAINGPTTEIALEKIKAFKKDLALIQPYHQLHQGCAKYCPLIAAAIVYYEDAIVKNKIELLVANAYTKSVMGYDVTDEDMMTIRSLIDVTLRNDLSGDMLEAILPADVNKLNAQIQSVSAALTPFYSHRKMKYLPCCETNVLQLDDQFETAAPSVIRKAVIS